MNMIYDLPAAQKQQIWFLTSRLLNIKERDLRWDDRGIYTGSNSSKGIPTEIWLS